LVTIVESLTRIERRQEKLEAELTGNGGMHESIENALADIGEHSSIIASLESSDQDLKHEVALLKRLVIKQDKQIHSLKGEVDELRGRSMSSNVIFHSIPDSNKKDENCESLVKDTIEDAGFTETVNFERVHRLGTYNSKSPHPRPIIGKRLHYKDACKLLEFVRSLPKGDKTLKITQQMTPDQLETRNKLGTEAYVRRTAR
jgi:hypothetical protein